MTPEQLKWVADIVTAGKAVAWEWKGDCKFGFKFVKNDELGICMTYSPLVGKYSINVRQ